MPNDNLLPFTLLGLLVCQSCGGSQEPAKAPDEQSAGPSDTGGDAETGAKGAPGDGVMQPKWTMIDGVRDCTGTILSSYVCIPPERREACTEKAWQELSSLSGDDALTPCALEPDIMTCTVPTKDDPDARCFAAERPTACSDEKWERVKDVKLVYPCEGG